MNHLTKFILIGLFFAGVVELVKVLSGDIIGYLVTLIIPYLPFLLFVYYFGKIIDKKIRDKTKAHLIHYLVFGLFGVVLIEWLLIGLSPWSNPDANPFLMLMFQLAMISYWGTVAFAPRMLLDDRKGFEKIKKSMMRFYIIFFVITYIIGFSNPFEIIYPIVILLTASGHLLLNIFYIWFFRSYRSNK